MVQAPPAATTPPLTHCVPEAGATIAKAPVPVTLVTVGAADRVSGPLPVLFTVIVPLLTLPLAGAEFRAGLGPAKPTTARMPVPVRAAGELDTASATPADVPLTVTAPL